MESRAIIQCGRLIASRGVIQRAVANFDITATRTYAAGRTDPPRDRSMDINRPPSYERGRENVQSGIDRAKEKVGEYKDDLRRKWGSAKNVSEDYKEGAREKAGDLAQEARGGLDKAKEKAGETWDKTKEKAGEYKEEMKHEFDQARRKLSGGYEKAKEKAGEYAHDVKEKAEDMKEKAGDYAQDAKEKAGSYTESVKSGYENVKEKVKQGMRQAEGYIRGDEALKQGQEKSSSEKLADKVGEKLDEAARKIGLKKD